MGIKAPYPPSPYPPKGPYEKTVLSSGPNSAGFRIYPAVAVPVGGT